jgi:integrase
MPSFKKDKNGKYFFSASLGFDAITGKRVQKMRSGFKTKKEAQQAYAELIANYGKDSLSSNSSMLFEEFFNTIFLPYYKSRVKERTYNNRLSTVTKEFSHFNKMKLSDIKPVHIQKWQNEMTKKYKNSYVRNIYGIFQIALDRAVSLGLLPVNNAKVVGNVKKMKVTVDFWTKEEFEKVVSTFYIEDYFQHFGFICIWLLFMTGMRVGEATALQWSDIDFEEKTLKINKTLNYKNAQEFEFVEPKTKASNRVIALDDVTMEYLKEWKKRQDRKGGIEYVLSYNGIPTQKHTIRHILVRHAKTADVHNIRIHALRHSHASLLISMGMNALLIKDRLGHEDIQTTLGTYGHLYPNTSFEVAEKLNKTINVNFSAESLVSDTRNQFVNDKNA